MEPPRVLHPFESVTPLEAGVGWPRSWRWAWRVSTQWLRRSLGLPVVLSTPDRRLLEQCILPHCAARSDVHRVLFVGADWYTERYQDFFAGRRYTTIDISPRVARHGSRQRHIVGSVVSVERHFDEESLDLIVFNGVFGWGLNERNEVERTLLGFHRVLRPGGLLIVGWNDLPRYRPFDFNECRALRRFERWRFEPLGASQWQLEGDNRHCFDFFRKPARPG